MIALPFKALLLAVGLKFVHAGNLRRAILVGFILGVMFPALGLIGTMWTTLQFVAEIVLLMIVFPFLFEWHRRLTGITSVVLVAGLIALVTCLVIPAIAQSVPDWIGQ